MFNMPCYVFMKFFIFHCEVDKNPKLLLYPVDENAQLLTRSVDNFFFHTYVSYRCVEIAPLSRKYIQFISLINCGDFDVSSYILSVLAVRLPEK